jgi:hypothetical protein
MMLTLPSEKLLQFVWLHKYFNTTSLETLLGESVTIHNSGEWNTLHEGPDFKNASITIGNTKWFGHVELHVKTSDWIKHKHDTNKHYQNIILHVVYEHDATWDNPVPIVIIKNLIPKSIIDKYNTLQLHNHSIPCKQQFNTVNTITLQFWKDNMLVERMMYKTKDIAETLEKNKYHWEQVFWQQLARSFGATENADCFELMATTINVNIIYSLKNNRIGLEALLMGQVGMLQHTMHDAYSCLLQREYAFIANKWKLTPTNKPVSYLRMRPSNFPTIRLSQLASLIHTSKHLFAKIRNCTTYKEVYKLFNVTTHHYWDTHYVLHEETKPTVKHLGNNMIDNIIINTCIPFMYYWGQFYNDEALKEKAFSWLKEIKAEPNSITKTWATLGWVALDAGETQAQINAYKQYCTQKKCLQCSIGNAILKK